MKQKILAALKLKFPGMPQAFLEFVATKMEPKVTEEAQIEGQITALESAPISLADQLSFFNAEADRRVTDAQKTWEAKNKKPESQEPAPQDAPKPADEMNAFQKQMMDQMKAMADQLAAINGATVAKTRNERMVNLFKEKKVPEMFYAHSINGRTFSDDAECDAVANSIVESWGKFSQDQANEGLKNQPVPVMGTPVANDSEVSPLVKQMVADKMPKPAPAAV